MSSSSSSPPATLNGAHIIARALRDLGVTVVFGIVGIPVVDVAEQMMNLGIRFIAFRNEQAASYAAGAYGYLTGKPGVLLVFPSAAAPPPAGLRGRAGSPVAEQASPASFAVLTDPTRRQIGNSSANAFPLLALAGASETHLATKGAFQELDAVSLLTPHTKLALRPASLALVPRSIATAYRHAWYGRPGPSFVDLPADLIQAAAPAAAVDFGARVAPPPRPAGDPARVAAVAALLRGASAPLIVVGKGAAAAGPAAAAAVRRLVESTRVPFLPTPMGKGVLPDGHALDAGAARGAALARADAVLVLGARLNWLLHFGEPPRWSPGARFAQVDLAPEELGRSAAAADAGLAVQGDVGLVAAQLLEQLRGWRYGGGGGAPGEEAAPPYLAALAAAKERNARRAAAKAADAGLPLSFERAFAVVRAALDRVAGPPERARVVYVSEGANAMDIARSAFRVGAPRHRLDAGTLAAMGVGLGYAVAAHAAYNGEVEAAPDPGPGRPARQRKKIVAIEGDSAFGFSAMEVETLARAAMDVLVFVMNNSGVYRGEAETAAGWARRRAAWLAGAGPARGGLRSTGLGFETRYDGLAEALGAKGYLARTPDELERATVEGFAAEGPVVVNVIIRSGAERELEFGWQGKSKKKEEGEEKEEKGGPKL
ncbi:hypothetical protein BDY21DRAFT_408426 [Lineolata rhizophorae]|uniref:2-hydroxyacyl-CoA lyase n=1 Tax=Lineolata rhizophorae TaxID=578093 RepID=A0A6A6P891_9PEZI|nr:hypothetical protein BDY21DRAFT_408426 [Lineolata rhizophorae]